MGSRDRHGVIRSEKAKDAACADAVLRYAKPFWLLRFINTPGALISS